jgi:hypothetical protein
MLPAISSAIFFCHLLPRNEKQTVPRVCVTASQLHTERRNFSIRKTVNFQNNNFVLNPEASLLVGVSEHFSVEPIAFTTCHDNGGRKFLRNFGVHVTE